MNKLTTDVPLEDYECEAFHKWLESKGYPHCHIANESRSGGRNAVIRGAKLKRMGQSSGVWDYEVYIPAKGITGSVDSYQQVRIEMKRKKGGTVSQAQRSWGRIYEKAGIPCRICKGADEAIKFIDEIIKDIEG